METAELIEMRDRWDRDIKRLREATRDLGDEIYCLRDAAYSVAEAYDLLNKAISDAKES